MSNSWKEGNQKPHSCPPCFPIPHQPSITSPDCQPPQHSLSGLEGKTEKMGKGNPWEGGLGGRRLESMEEEVRQ